MDIVRKQSAATGGTIISSSISATFSNSHTGNKSEGLVHTFIAIVGHGVDGDNVSSITGISNLDKSWVQAKRSTRSATPVTTEIWYAQKKYNDGDSESALTITVNWITNFTGTLIIVEYVGVADGFTGTINLLDQTASNIGSSNNPDTGTTSTTTRDRELWLGMMASGTSTNYSSGPVNGFSTVENIASSNPAVTDMRLVLAEKIVTTTGTANTNATLSATRPWAGAIATFKEEYNIYPGRETGQIPSVNNSIVDPIITPGNVALLPDSVILISGIINPVFVIGSITISPNPILLVSSLTSSLLILGTVTLLPNFITLASNLISPSLVIGSSIISPNPISLGSGAVSQLANPGMVNIDSGIIVSIYGSNSPSLVIGLITLLPNSSVITTGIITPSLVIGLITLLPTAVTNVFSLPSPSLNTPIYLLPDPAISTFNLASPNLDIGPVTIYVAITGLPPYSNFNITVPVIFSIKELLPNFITSNYNLIIPIITPGIITLLPSPTINSFNIINPIVTLVNKLLPNPVIMSFSIVSPVVDTGGVILSPSPVLLGSGSSVVSIEPGLIVVSGVVVEAVFEAILPAISIGSIVIYPDPTLLNLVSIIPVFGLGEVIISPITVNTIFNIPLQSVIEGEIINQYLDLVSNIGVSLSLTSLSDNNFTSNIGASLSLTSLSDNNFTSSTSEKDLVSYINPDEEIE